MVDKTLVFHFYVDPLYKEKISYKMHFACLKEWCDIFTNAIFVLSVDDKNNIKLINDVEKDIIDCGFSCPIKFDIAENDEYREVHTLKKYIIDKLNEYDGLVFFGHTKGTTNIDNYGWLTENYLHWIFSLYYYSLEYENEVVKKLIENFGGHKRAMYGPMGTVNGDGNIFYPGTFYWLNCKKIIEDVNSKEIELPILCDRSYAECFPLIYKSGVKRVTSHWDYIMTENEPFLNEQTKSLYDETDWGGMADFYLDRENYEFKYNKIRNSL